jgi:hypothetical protein
MTFTLRLSRALALTALACLATHLHAAVGDTRIANWKDDRTAAFMLMFDDGAPSHWQIAIPEMSKRGLIGTFYINPGKAEFTKFKDVWTKIIPSTGNVYGNHTMSHQGVKDLVNARWEIGECSRIIRELVPGKATRLISYGQPGVGPGKWNISGDELKTLLKEDNLVSRPPFDGHGAVYHKKTLDDMTALAEKAIASKGTEYLVIHGVERITPDWGYQDFWALKQTIFFPLLDYLKTKQDARELWITDHITWHQYKTGREAATVKTLKVIANGIQLELRSSADPALYDLPLTLVTEVPAHWRTCNISQGGSTPVTATAKDGVLIFDAIPNGPPISLWPAQ